MKLYKKMITGTVLLAGLAGLFGCGGNNSSNNTTPAAPKPKNFASIPMYAEGGMGMTCGDFDGDGDLDLVVGGSASASGLSTAGKIYQFNNDGKGNFSQEGGNY